MSRHSVHDRCISCGADLRGAEGDNHRCSDRHEGCRDGADREWQEYDARTYSSRLEEGFAALEGEDE